ncbi:T9SS type A sorting domain-containing protein [uncultured Apibacter sp.]|uniref:leucine-rich repeat domain-containing protein n=1 Tax=uncultured Apibacter sp. TaxID=1778616 RepID=UPI0025F50579|nr:T9SS type A sorting domain-containing protein [uncultured Apibacter sp.]
MKKTLLFVIVYCIVNTIALASGNVSDKQEYLKTNYVATENSNYDAMDVFGILNFLMQYSKETQKWNYELSGLTWEDMSKAIKGDFNVILEHFPDSFIWKETNGTKILIEMNIFYKKYTGKFDGRYFKNLEVLSCGFNKFSSLDLSNNTKLIRLGCSSNELTELDLSKNVNLEIVECRENQLTSLDMSKNVNLKRLGCESNQLTSLDVSKNVNLEILYCSSNQLTSLDVLKNVNLQELNCSSNQLSKLVTDNPKLIYISCDDNQLTSLEVSQNVNLEFLYCSSNQLTSLDVSKNVNLKRLGCSSNQLTSLDLSKNVNLEVLGCYSNQLTSLDVSKNDKLYFILFNSNNITSLSIPKEHNISIFGASDNQLKFSTVQGNYQAIQIPVWNPQATLQGGTKGYFDVLDLSSEYLIDGKVTIYNWYDKANKEEVNMYALKGKFYASPENAGKTLICQMTNELFPGFILEYEVTIKDEMISSRNVKTTIPEGFKLVGSKGKHKALESVQLTPNPVVDILKVNTASKVESANVYSYTGKEVKRIPTVYNNELNLQDLPSGIYMISIKTEQGMVTQKVIKK